MKPFEGKVAVVTGGSSGIGRSCAEFFARDGARVVVADMDEQGGQETVEHIKASGSDAVFTRVDVSKPADCEAMVRTAVERFGRLDYACNNAGVSGEQSATADYPIESWQRVIGINLSGVFYGMKYQIPAMLQNGGGAIVNMASILGEVGFPLASAYVAAKHGVVGITQNAALEYAQQGIRVNAVGPGFIKTPLISDATADPAMRDMLVALHPIGRLGTPEEVAELVVWLCSDKASFVTGAYVPVDGGYLAR